MTSSGEHGLRVSPDYHFTDSLQPDVLIVPGDICARIVIEDPTLLTTLKSC
ncbi:hypothetical protein J8L73_06305 [Pseudoalteromonas sp. MMG006]|uniref:hypothetical protein n=1 Tax=Pseudoalteromonas sp. MMG006 TaxID=2822683 RepID=UPI001B38594D|nr:hypothetical protein [Pseudoalteromonas sp. MMG006]MBQ4798740.1 hypothetical protein [Pseudoalteromonas sp. MMG006]